MHITIEGRVTYRGDDDYSLTFTSGDVFVESKTMCLEDRKQIKAWFLAGLNAEGVADSVMYAAATAGDNKYWPHVVRRLQSEPSFKRTITKTDQGQYIMQFCGNKYVFYGDTFEQDYEVFNHCPSFDCKLRFNKYDKAVVIDCAAVREKIAEEREKADKERQARFAKRMAQETADMAARAAEHVKKQAAALKELEAHQRGERGYKPGKLFGFIG